MADGGLVAEVVGGADPDLPPGQLILTLFGLYARAAGGRLPVAGIVRLMAALGADSTTVRSAVSRLKRRQIVYSVQDGGAAYELSPAGQAMLADGDRRIFGARSALLAEGWCLVTFSVPETERDRRHRLRTALNRLGFGWVAPGVAVAPGRMLPVVREILAREGLAEYVDLFHADVEAADREQAAAKVAHWWDLAALDRLYRNFLRRHEPTPAARGKLGADPEAAFARYVPMLTRWRRLPYLDPGLPAELLPAGWSGTQARDLFETLSATLRPPAHEYAARYLPGLPGLPGWSAAPQSGRLRHRTSPGQLPPDPDPFVANA